MKTKTTCIINIILAIILFIAVLADITSINNYIKSNGLNAIAIGEIIFCLIAIPFGIFGLRISIKELTKKENGIDDIDK